MALLKIIAFVLINLSDLLRAVQRLYRAVA
jgi:hypothetical protein